MILHGKLTEDDRAVVIHIQRDRISRIGPFPEGSEYDPVDPDLYVAPGLFDPHVNGFAGVDFNGKNLSLEEVHQAAEALSATGVTTFFPTLITAPLEKLLRQLKILREVMEADPFVSAMCGGIHLEGPYISPVEGPRGVHPSQFIRPPRWEEFEKFQAASGGRIKLITLAPEREGSLDFIKRAVANGVVVAIGHTAASEETLDAACRAGARLSTHIGNGIGRSFDRYRNPFQKQLAMEGLMASVIADGIHLPDYVVKNIVKAKGTGGILLITDAISATANPPGKYSLGDLEVEVRENGKACLFGTESLAGSTLSMPRAITNVMKFTGIDLGTALKMATENGRQLFPELISTLAADQPANLLFFRFNKRMTIEKVFLRGKEVWPLNPSFSPSG